MVFSRVGLGVEEIEVFHCEPHLPGNGGNGEKAENNNSCFNLILFSPLDYSHSCTFTPKHSDPVDPFSIFKVRESLFYMSVSENTR